MHTQTCCRNKNEGTNIYGHTSHGGNCIMQMDVLVNLQNNASVPLAKFDDAQIYSFAIFIYLFIFLYV